MDNLNQPTFGAMGNIMSKYRVFIALLIVAAFVTLCVIPSMAAEDEQEMSPPWSMSNGDARLSGVSPFIMEEMPEDVIWEMELSEDPVGDIAIGPTGLIYMAFEDRISTFDNDGQLAWTYEVDGLVYVESKATSCMAIDGSGTVYFFEVGNGSETWSLIAVNEHGELLYDKQISSKMPGPLVVTEQGAVYFVSLSFDPSDEYGYRYDLNEVVFDNGTITSKVFILPQNGVVVKRPFSPSIAPDGKVIFPAGSEIFAITTDQWPVWSLSMADLDDSFVGPVGEVCIDEAGNLYLAAAHCVYSIDRDGEMRWKFEDEDLEFPKIASVGEGAIIIESRNEKSGFEFAEMITTEGSFGWKVQGDQSVYAIGGVSVTTSDGQYILCGNEAIVSYYVSNGTEVWRTEVARADDSEVIRTVFDPVVGENDTLYLMTFEDGAYSFYAVGNWLEEAVYNFVLLFSLMFAPFFIIAGCYFYFREDKK